MGSEDKLKHEEFSPFKFDHLNFEAECENVNMEKDKNAEAVDVALEKIGDFLIGEFEGI